MNCIECDGVGYCWYGNRTTYAICEICGGTGHLDNDARKLPHAPETPLWPVHDPDALRRNPHV